MRALNRWIVESKRRGMALEWAARGLVIPVFGGVRLTSSGKNATVRRAEGGTKKIVYRKTADAGEKSAEKAPSKP